MKNFKFIEVIYLWWNLIWDIKFLSFLFFCLFFYKKIPIFNWLFFLHYEWKYHNKNVNSFYVLYFFFFCMCFSLSSLMSYLISISSSRLFAFTWFFFLYLCFSRSCTIVTYTIAEGANTLQSRQTSSNRMYPSIFFMLEKLQRKKKKMNKEK